MRIACILTVFPSVAETFIFGDFCALENAGHEVGIMHFINGDKTVWQEGARKLESNVVRGGPLISPGVIRDFLVFLLRRPAVVIGTLWWIVMRRGVTLRGRLKTLVILPKCVQFAADCQRWKADQVHAAWANHAAVAALVVERLTGIPFSMSAHAGLDILRDPYMVSEKIERARFVVACNRMICRKVLETAGSGARGKVHYLSHGVDLELFQWRARSGVRHDDDDLRTAEALAGILFVGRLQYGKGIPYLIEAADLLRSEGRKYRLHLVGQGPDLRKVELDIQQRGLVDRIVLHGAIKQVEVATMLSSADVLVLPSELGRDSNWEGLPNILLEALASGVPVVASRVASVEDAIEDGISGLLVPQRDPTALANAIGRILDDPELARHLSANGRRVVEERFARSACTRRFASLFETPA